VFFPSVIPLSDAHQTSIDPFRSMMMTINASLRISKASGSHVMHKEKKNRLSVICGSVRVCY
jgi:hypothetical protein